MPTKFAKPRGTRDILSDTITRFQFMENVARETFHKYGFNEIKTPTFEEKELFCRSIGDTTDIVEKEMYLFTDKKGRELVLRPEGTAGVVRAYIENDMDKVCAITKLYYYEQMFRYERPQSGRYREFYQIGAECFGDSTPGADAEIILIAMVILNKLNLKNKVELLINSLGCSGCRQEYRKALIEKLGSKIDSLCEDCRKRFIRNPLRVLDCKKDADKLAELPKITEYLCDECKQHFNKLQILLNSSGCEYVIDPYLVRGLDYYTKTIFEIKLKDIDIAENTVIAGGRYDGLVKELGGNSVPACGFAIGVDRLSQYIVPENSSNAPGVFLAVIGNNNLEYAVEKHVLKLANKLRENNISVMGPFFEKSLKSQLRLADSLKINNVIIIGEQEIGQKQVIVRKMDKQSQEPVKEENIVEYLKK